jgi:hypothetical protein
MRAEPEKYLKLMAVPADIQDMQNANNIPFGPGHPRYEEAQAFEKTVRVIRKAQGKKNPEDFPYGSSEWQEADEAYVRDLLRAMGENPDDLK